MHLHHMPTKSHHSSFSLFFITPHHPNSKSKPQQQPQQQQQQSSSSMATTTPTQLHDLPDAILTHIFTLISDVRSRNSLALTSKKYFPLERSTRTSLSLRGNIRDLFLLPTSFSSIARLDLSLLSPWGHPFNDADQELVALRLRQAFPNLVSLKLYDRNCSSLNSLLPQWPGLKHVSLVRWHQRPPLHRPGADLEVVFDSCPSLSSLDLSRFYFWTEDVPAALQMWPSSAAALVRLDLLSEALSDGFRSSEVVAVSAACPNLEELRAPCVVNPMHFDFVSDHAIVALGSNCPKLVLLHLVEPDSDGDVASGQDSRISVSGLERLFNSLPGLEDLVLDFRHGVRDAGLAMGVLGNRCPKIKRLRLGQFQSVCRAAGLHLDGVAICGGLQSLCIRNSSDLTDSSLVAIARGCRRLLRFEIDGCDNVTEKGIKEMASMLRSTLVEVRISGCKHLDTASSLRALAPIRDRIVWLHIDCIWVASEPEQIIENKKIVTDEFDLDDFEREENGSLPNKKCRYSDEHPNNGNIDMFWLKSWDRLRYLSLWLPAGEVLSPLAEAGLDDCPNLEETIIKIEGDCRTCPRPTQPVFGLSCLSIYPRLTKMKLDCGDAIGYAFTAPMGQMDLSLWERFYLHGINSLSELYELDYWPPQDKEVNQRSLSLPAAGLIQGCFTLRKLFIHGTAHEHFMRFFLQMPNLRDVQLREDYYPAPENDMSTEMRVDSCSRFEDALNSRIIPD